MKKVLVLLAPGFEEVEALSIVDFLRRVEIPVETASTTEDLLIKGSHGINVQADVIFDDVKSLYDAVMIPGGIPGAPNLRDNEKVIEYIKKMHDAKKYIAAICAGPIVLEKASVIKDKKVTSYPGFEAELKSAKYINDNVVVDENIITSRGPATAILLAVKLAEILKDKASSDKLKNGLLLPLLLNEK